MHVKFEVFIALSILKLWHSTPKKLGRYLTPATPFTKKFLRDHVLTFLIDRVGMRVKFEICV